MKGLFMTLVFLLILSSFTSAYSYVGINKTQFTLDNHQFYFAGTNNYYLWYADITCSSPAANQGCLIPILDQTKALNLTVIRTWGFGNGQFGYSFQPAPNIYDEETFAHFDRVIKEASDRNIKLIIPLVNNWEDFGGMCQYVKWCNLTNASLCNSAEPYPFGIGNSVHDLFYTNECTKSLYKNYTSYFLNRVNTQTGIKYKDDPTILAWELANEPRARSDKTCVKLNSWIGEMSSYIKSLDSNHLVTTGIDGGYKNKVSNPSWSWWYHGNEGQDFFLNHNWTTIDFATFHYYSDSFGSEVNVNTWISEHINDSHLILKKPVIFEEFNTKTDRANILSSYYALSEKQKIDGTLFWMLAEKRTSGYDDGYFVYCPEDSACKVISSHANFMNNLTSPKSPPVKIINYTLTGRITYTYYNRDYSKLPLKIQLVNNKTKVEKIIYTDKKGNFILNEIPEGIYNIKINSTHWLPYTKSNFNISKNSSLGIISLINGDCNLDEKIDIKDLKIVVKAMNTSPGKKNYNPAADLDGNKRINVVDLLIVLKGKKFSSKEISSFTKSEQQMIKQSNPNFLSGFFFKI